MNRNAPPKWWQRTQLDLRVLWRLFPWRVGATMLVGLLVLAAIVQQAYQRVYPDEIFTYVRAIYAVLNMALFQVSFADMPISGAMDVFFVIIPLLSFPFLVMFGARLVNVIRVYFVRGERGQQWQIALANTVEKPIVVCGLGRIGYRVANELLDLGRPVIGIEHTPSPLVEALIERDMPVILGDVRRVDVLREGGVERARTVLVCTHNDMTNIEAAFHVRKMNPDADIVLRLFEDEIAENLKRSFNIKAVVSRSAIAAESFAYAALGLESMETFPMPQATYVLAKVPVNAMIAAKYPTVGPLADAWDATVTCKYSADKLITEPAPTEIVSDGDTLILFTQLARLRQLTALTARKAVNDPLASELAPVLVCGLGHTGYRVANVLHNLGQPVIALDFEADRLSQRLSEYLPVYYGDVRQVAFLESVGIREAKALITCSDDDMQNFETTIRARELNPYMRIVMRIFEQSLGTQLQQVFDIDAVYSTSEIAAPMFTAAALDMHRSQAVEVDGTEFVIARMSIAALSRLHRERVGTLTDLDDLTVLLHRRGENIVLPPDPDCVLQPGDEIVVLASRDKLRELSFRNRATRDVA